MKTLERPGSSTQMRPPTSTRASRSTPLLALLPCVVIALAACGNKGDLYLPGTFEDEARVRLLETDGAVDESVDGADPTTGPSTAPLLPGDADPSDDDAPGPSRRTPRPGADS